MLRLFGSPGQDHLVQVVGREKWPGRFQVPGRLPGEELRGLELLSRGGRLYLLSVMLSTSNADLHRRSSCPHNCFNYVLPPQTEEHLYHFQYGLA